MNTDYAQFNMYWCDLEPTFGHQMKKTRPCVIVSPDEMNNLLGTVIVVPLTSTFRKFPFYVQVMYRNHNGALACDQIKTIDKKRVGKHFAPLTKKDTAALSSTLSAMFKSGS